MKNLIKFFVFVFSLSIIFSSFAFLNKVLAVDSCPGLPTVSYGGKVYDTVQIGTQCWLKQNLNIGTRINNSVLQTNNAVVEKYCYNDLESNCDVYGGMYQWNEAMQYVTTEGAQGICPSEWHIPTKNETVIMDTYLGGTAVAGGKLKEIGTTHWKYPNMGATNSSGFTALPGGYSYRYNTTPYFSKITETGYIPTSTQNSSTLDDDYVFRGMISTTSGLTSPNNYKSTAVSIRCIKNSTPSSTSPGQPTNLTGVFGLFSTYANLSWTAPSNNGGSPITDYKIEYKPTSSGTWVDFSHTPSINTSIKITNLTLGTSYDYRVSAINAIGTGPSVSITAPSQISGLVAVPGNGQIILSWNIPNNGGSPLTNYIVDYKLASASVWSSITIPSVSATKTVIGLTNGSNYNFRVRAWGSSAGPWSSIVNATPAVPATVPSQPINFKGVFDTDHVNLSWDVPSSNGNSPITGYLIEYRQASVNTWTSDTSTTTSKTISGLLGGSMYEYKVSAQNAIGTGPSALITSPSKVTELNVIPGKGQVLVSWKAPNDGGSPITEYRLRYKLSSDSGSPVWGTLFRLPATTTSYTIVGLTNGASYDFKIRAWGSSAGPWSDVVSASLTSFVPVVDLVDLTAGVGNAEIVSNENTTLPNIENDSFSLSLSYGKEHSQVRMLQQFLNNFGYPVDGVGAGSLGNETFYFGKATKAALMKFQKENNIKNVNGKLDLATRTLINKILKDSI